MRAKQRNKIRKSTKYFSIIIAIVLFVTSFSSLVNNLSKENQKVKTKQIYSYTNKFNYDYKVNLKQNKYIKQTNDNDKTLAYVTDLIDNTDLMINYEYIADKESDLQYTYNIVGRMQIVYTKDGEEQKIWDEEETLLEETQSQIKDKKITIREKLNLDLKDKNELLNQFKQQMGMTIDAKYTVTLKVDIKTNVEQKDIQDNYTSAIQLDLAEKTTKITGDNDKEDSEYISKEYKVNGAKNVIIIILDIILLGISIILIRYATRSRTANRVKNEFRIELNRILKICQDKIVQVSTRPNDSAESVVLVKDFGEIIKLSEELFKPILYYYDTDKEEAWFSIMSGGITYRYILKR